MLPPSQGELKNQSTRRNYTNQFKNNKEPAFVPVMGQFNKKWNSILFDAERRLLELLLTEVDNVIKKIETEFDQD